MDAAALVRHESVGVAAHRLVCKTATIVTRTSTPSPTRALGPILILDPSLAITGAFRAAARAAALLAPRPVWVAVPENAAIADDEYAPFTAVIRLPLVQIRRSTSSLLRYVPALISASLKLRRALRDHAIGTLIVNDVYLLHGAVVRLMGFRGRIITFVRSDPDQMPGPLRRVWVGAALRYGDKLVAVASHIAAKLPAHRKLRRIFDAVPASGFPIGNPAESMRILYVANFTRGKGQDIALEAFANVASSFPDTRLHFVGGDFGLEKNRVFRRELERRAEVLGMAPRVLFDGFRSNVATLYAASRLALNCSKSEGLSNTCLEASAAGLPVIATRCGGPEEIIDDGRTGFLVPVGDVPAVAEAITKLLRDPDLARRMGIAGAKRIRDVFGDEVFLAAFGPLLEA